jgi:acetyltransferase-like isoleucine patch superfamily enzyme
MPGSYGLIRYGRVVSTVASIILMQSIVCGLAALPVVVMWQWIDVRHLSVGAQSLLISALVVPSFAMFALTLILISPIVNRLTGTRSPDQVTLRLADLDPALLMWMRFVVSIYIVRVFAGTLLRGTPVWTAYLRWNGARIGRGVFINTLSITDHNLLSIGNNVVIGADVRMSGHTVESGLLKTGRVTIGDDVTIGIGAVIDIGVRIGNGAQVGALSLVTKFMTLETNTTYAGIPAVPLIRPADTRPDVTAT